MRLRPDAELGAFRDDVRGFIHQNLTDEVARRTSRATYNSIRDIDDTLWWTSVLHRKGWSVPHWPVEHGGTGWTAMQHYIFGEEMALADAPTGNVQGTHLAGPIICMFGSPEQQKTHLPGIREGLVPWAQGFSEPNAGSDLASLRTSAQRDGGDWVINGQKIWTSGAYQAEWGFLLVRTSQRDRPQQGISFMLVPMTSPGITIRRIPQINSDSHLCEVFLDAVRVPSENLVGEEGQGWSYAKALLNLERADSSFIYLSKREVRRINALIEAELDETTPSAEATALRLRVAEVAAKVDALEWSVLRMIAGETRTYSETAASSALKVRGSDLQQEITEIQLDIAGLKGLRRYDRDTLNSGEFPTDGFWSDAIPGRSYGAIYSRASTIYGGSRQIQCGIIAKSAFGL